MARFSFQAGSSPLAAMVGEKGQDWHLLTAGAFLSMILPLAVFFSLLWQNTPRLVGGP